MHALNARTPRREGQSLIQSEGAVFCAGIRGITASGVVSSAHGCVGSDRKGISYFKDLQIGTIVRSYSWSIGNVDFIKEANRESDPKRLCRHPAALVCRSGSGAG